MKIKIIALTLLTSAVICEAASITITTAFGSGADAQVSENNNVSGGDGTGATLNARHDPGMRQQTATCIPHSLLSTQPP